MKGTTAKLDEMALSQEAKAHQRTYQVPRPFCISCYISTKTVKVVQTQLSMKFWGWECIIQSNHMNTKANIEGYYNNNFRYRTLPARLWKKWLICINPMLQQDKIWHVIFQNWPQNTTMSLSTYKDCHSLNSTFLTWHYGLLIFELPDNSILIFVRKVISFSFLFELLTGYVSWLWSEIS